LDLSIDRMLNDDDDDDNNNNYYYYYIIIIITADKSLARTGRKQATATEDFEFHLSYL